jgi:hypothetical protein
MFCQRLMPADGKFFLSEDAYWINNSVSLFLSEELRQLSFCETLRSRESHKSELTE